MSPRSSLLSDNNVAVRSSLQDKPLPNIPRASSAPRHSVKVEESYGGAATAIKPREVGVSLWDRLVTNWWGLELAAWLSATLSTFAIVVVFARFDQKPVSSWRSGVTPNALLQILSQIGQTAVLLPVVESISQLKWLWYRDSHCLDDMTSYANARTSPFATLWLLWQRRRV